VDADRPALNPLPRWWWAGAVGLPAATIAVFFAAPMLVLATQVVDGSAVRRGLTAPGVWQAVWFTVWQTIVSTAVTVVVGFVPAALVSRYRFAGRRALLLLTTVPFLLPTIVVGAAFRALLPDALDGSVWAVVAAHAYFNVALMVRLVGSLWARLPADLANAAATLGTSPARSFVAVTLPLLRPAVAAAAAGTAALCFTSYGVVAALGNTASPTLEMEIARRAIQVGDVGAAAVQALLQLVLLITAGAVGVAAARRHGRSDRRTPALTTATGDATAHGRTSPAAAVAAFACSALWLAPLIALVASSLRIGGDWSLAGWRALRSSSTSRPGSGIGVDAWASIARSAQLASVAAALTVIIAAAATWAIMRGRRRLQLIEAVLALPLATSAVTLGLALIVTFDVGLIDWRGSWWMLSVGHVLIALPVAVRTLLPAARLLGNGPSDAAATLGASALRAWWHVDVAALRRPLVTAAAFAAAISIGEFGATTVLSRTGADTLPLATAELLGRAGAVPRAQGFALATIMLVVVGIVAALTDPLDRRGAHRRD
jgi:thiamine transport system permease protein